MNYISKLFAQCVALLVFAALSTLILLTDVKAQSTTIFGGNSIARECYQASLVAARTGFSSRLDLETCDTALFQGSLKSRDRVATYVNRGIIKVALQDFVGGVRDYERALEMDPESAEAYLNRGNLWFLAKKYQEAIDDYSRSIEFEVMQEQVAILNIGLSYEYLQQFDMAKSYYESALEKAPEWELALEKLERVNRKINADAMVE